jgi:hypothetical protein
MPVSLTRLPGITSSFVKRRSNFESVVPLSALRGTSWPAVNVVGPRNRSATSAGMVTEGAVTKRFVPAPNGKPGNVVANRFPEPKKYEAAMVMPSGAL